MRRLKLAVIVIAVLALGGAAQAPTGSRGIPHLQGAWQAIFSSYEAPDTSWQTNHPPANLYLFMKTHYSIMTEWGTEPRQPFRDGRHPTEAEELAALRGLVANSGTYELTDSALTVRPIISRNPNFASDLPNSGHARTNRFSYRLHGDTLWLQRLRTWARDTTKFEVLRTTLLRVE